VKLDFYGSLLYFSVFYLALFIGDISLSSFQKIVSSNSLAQLEKPKQRLGYAVVPLIILFAVLCFGMNELFHWTTEPSMKFRSLYLSPTAFYIRNVIYFALWFFIARQQTKGPKLPAPLVFLLMILSITFASIDWVQSLDSKFHSTAFGLIFFLSCALVTLALRLTQVREDTAPATLIKLNNLHLAFIGSWAYVVFMQFLIVWSGNIPKESHWYIIRLQTSWGAIAIVVTALQFAIPVFLLFFRPLKKSVVFTRGLGYVTAAMQALYLFWLVMPSLYHDGLPARALPIASLLGVLALASLHYGRADGVT
jgi:hypothetical protein